MPQVDYAIIFAAAAGISSPSQGRVTLRHTRASMRLLRRHGFLMLSRRWPQIRPRHATYMLRHALIITLLELMLMIHATSLMAMITSLLRANIIIFAATMPPFSPLIH